jgi:TonB-dependent starch-binding outer membrane protein SusC
MKTMLKKLLFLLLVLPLGAFAQGTLTGKIVDQTTNENLVGAVAAVVGTNQAASTGFDGSFTLTKLKNGDVISFSYLGYNTEKITYQGQTKLNVTLFSAANGIEGIVLVGYGKVKKKDNTGSVTQITEKDFNKGATPTVENLLNGRVAGLTINTEGGPAGNSTIRIRGGSSLTASNDPLIVVDGLPIDNSSIATAGSRNYLSTIDPNTIESINVLKDASATAIYGSRASNGVIIITTKRGSKKLSVDYDFQYGSGNVVKTIDVLNSSDFVRQIQQNQPTLVNLLGIDDPANNLVDNPATPEVEGRLIYDTNWQNEIYRRTDYVKNSLNITGNLFDAVPVRVSLGNTYQEGLVLTDDYTRTSLGLTLSPSFFNNHLKVTFNGNYAKEKNTFAEKPIGGALRFDPTKPIYDSRSPWGGYAQHLNSSGAFLAGGNNPFAQILQTQNNATVNRLIGNFQVDYKFHFLPALRAVVNVGFDESIGSGVKNINKDAVVSDGNGGNLITNKFGNNELYDSRFINRLLDGYLVYNKKFGKLDFEATGGYSYQIFKKARFASGNTRNTTINNADINTSTDKVLIGFFGRTNLSWNDKYLLTFTMRRDGTSVFAKENRYGNFPAAAFAWKINKDLFTESKTLTDLKLRLGWGITGQQDLGIDKNGNPYNDFFQPQFATSLVTGSQYTFGNTVYSVGAPSAYNPKLKWEETTTYNAGLDFGLFGRVTGNVDAYYRKTKDLFNTDTPFADGTNFSNAGPQNIGELEIKGIEVNLNADVIKSENFNWNVNVNATKFERRITSLYTGASINVGGISGPTGGTIQTQTVGFTPNSFYVYSQLYNQDGTPASGSTGAAFADLTGEGNLTNADRYIYKNPDPDVVLGFQSQMNYKNLDFSFNLRASIGNQVYNNVNSSLGYKIYLADNAVPGNIPTSTFGPNFNTPEGNTNLSDYFIENASFLRMDNATVGYTFPKWLEGKAALRLSLGVQNPFVITNYSGIDPEVNGGIDNTIYPRQRQILFGANIKF